MRTRAIILRKQATNEYDQLVTCYTEELGRLVAIAKGANRPGSIQGMHLDLFNLVDFDLINGRSTPIITGAQAEETYPNLKNNLATLATAYFFAETADKLFFDYQRDESLWDFFTSLMHDLNSNPADISRFLKLKQTEFLDLLGYAPNLSECAFCSASMQSGISAYSVEVRGAICQDCFLAGQRGMVIRNNNLFTGAILGVIFESLAEKKLSSLSFINQVIKTGSVV